MELSGKLIEIYASLQGEGVYVGHPMIFVRFQECALHCRFCDTPASFIVHPEFKLETTPFSAHFRWVPNPIPPSQLDKVLQPFGDLPITLTGGEPLQQADFIAAWLKKRKTRSKVLLETNGVLPIALEKVLDQVDTISMDIKLPSVTGMKEFWREHVEFLKLARRKELYIKVVVSEDTDREELNQAISIVEKQAPHTPFILQPVTPTENYDAKIVPSKLKELYNISAQRLSDVRVIPQVHSILGIL
jgi:organic radical activating enzyme